MRGPDRRRAAGSVTFPLRLSNGALIPTERRHGSDRRQLDFILNQEIFQGVPDNLIQPILSRCPVRELRAGEIVLSPGQLNDHLYLVLGGRLQVHLDAPDSPKGFPLYPGQCFGEMSVIDDRPASAFVVAEAGTRVLAVHKEVLWSELIPLGGVARNLLRVLSERIRARTETTLTALRQELAYEQLQRELQIARELQASMLPTTFPLFQDRPEVDLFAVMEPAREIGGDFFDAFPLDGRRVLFAVGDVAGKGMPAALLMVRSLTLLRTEARRVADLPALLVRVNEELRVNSARGMFVTLFVGVLDVPSGELTYVNAGHLPPLLVRQGRPLELLPMPEGLVVGAIEEASFEPAHLQMHPGDALLVYTDGVTEARDAAGRFFSHERLHRLFDAREAGNASELVHALKNGLVQFSGDAARADDVTILALVYRGSLDA
jgi:sigma-B regulation protein RsbU (phosphoserine phosphatase)